MAEPDRPQSPFAGMADFSVRTPVRALSPDEIERMLAEHRLYLETEYHQGHRANFSSADLTGRDFSGLNLSAVVARPPLGLALLTSLAMMSIGQASSPAKNMTAPTAVRGKFAVDSPLEGSGFEPPVPGAAV